VPFRTSSLRLLLQLPKLPEGLNQCQIPNSPLVFLPGEPLIRWVETEFPLSIARVSENKRHPELIALSANLTQHARNSIINIMTPSVKPVEWIGSSLSDLRKFPEEVQKSTGFALYLAQLGKKHLDAKPLKGFKGSGVLEVVDDFDGDTYRAVYTVRFEGMVYVLHAFQKKSKQGIATPKQDIELIEARLKRAREQYQSQFRQENQEQ
jgi:phage-related protein